MKHLKHRPSPATALSAVALFLAVGGGSAVAATHLLVHTKNIANGAVTNPKLGKGSVGLAKLSSIVRGELNGNSGVAGGQGATGPKGATGTTGAPGPAGATGSTGATGDPGISSQLVHSYAGTSGPDSGTCGNNWATDTYNATITVQPQTDGSYTLTKIVSGTFVTTAGVSEPNPSSCPGVDQNGGVNGTFYGTESWSVTSPDPGSSAEFDPMASCGSVCSPKTTSTSSNDAQNQAFEAAFFPGATYAGVTNFDFVYHTAANGSWIDSNTPVNNTGNITG